MAELVTDAGNTVTVTATIRNGKTKEPTDPDVVVCTVRPPDGSPNITPELERIEAGVYEATFDVLVPGRWYVAIDGVGAVKAAKEVRLTVKEPHVVR